ncbi:Anaphase-promoting complex subunit 4 WD40 domain-containing protein [Plasmodiophora brassicae]|uniref:Anaphase-promoting complex subunit 4 WD40 domain-containing protein n=1 Tax=Plasmodiophora brassicae TaxID=37360 RepID=A0A3P3XYY4_PLABS|nr:unnamed protein product [Plasmodiophora brassicae]
MSDSSRKNSSKTSSSKKDSSKSVSTPTVSGDMDQILAETLSMDVAGLLSPSGAPAPSMVLPDSEWLNTVDVSSIQDRLTSSLYDPFTPNPNPFLLEVDGVANDTTNSLSYFDPIESAELPTFSSPLLQSRPPPVDEPPVGIRNWSNDAADAKGYTDGHDCNLLTMLQASRFSDFAKSLSTGPARNASASICKASRDPDNSDMVILGTSERLATSHVVMAVNAGLLLSTSDPDADALIQSVDSCPAHVRELHWISSGRVIVAHDSSASVYQVSNRFELRKQSTLIWAHTDEIRELAFNPSDVSKFAAGGFDQILSLNDLGAGTKCTVTAVRLDEVIGSVGWPEFDLHSVTATTDDGRFFQFDNRTSMRKASLFIDAQKLQLYTHSLYLPNLVLLGFGDGEIMQVDTRMMSFVTGTRDPFVESIGDITPHSSGRTLLVTGESDVSLWSVDVSGADARIWSHCNMTKGDAMYTNAIFGSRHDIVIKTDQLGYLGVYQHDLI